MNNGLKALLIAASTIITCIIVTLGFSLARQAREIGNNVTEDLERYKTVLAERNIVKYDGAVVLGGDVVNLIRVELAQSKPEYRITIQNSNTTWSFDTLKDYETALSNDSSCIDLNGEYLGKVIRNKNDVISEIRFEHVTT